MLAMQHHRLDGWAILKRVESTDFLGQTLLAGRGTPSHVAGTMNSDPKSSGS
jgi:hypothetical protein